MKPEMKNILILIAVVSVVFAAGCVSSQQNVTANSSIQVSVGSHIAVDYTGTLQNGTVFDSSLNKTPLEFDAGRGQMIKGFDAAVIGMHVGDEKSVTILPADAYGPYDPRLIVTANLTELPNGTYVGETLYAGMQPVKVIKIENGTVWIDENHPLAGQTLVFWIKVVRID